MLEVRGDHLMMILVKYTELVGNSVVAEIDDTDFFEWLGGIPVTPALLAEYLNSGRDGWQGELKQLTGRSIADGGEIVSVEHW